MTKKQHVLDDLPRDGQTVRELLEAAPIACEPFHMSQVNAVRWRLLTARDRLRVRSASTFVPMPMEDAVRILFNDFNGDVTVFESACVQYRENGGGA